MLINKENQKQLNLAIEIFGMKIEYSKPDAGMSFNKNVINSLYCTKEIRRENIRQPR